MQMQQELRPEASQVISDILRPISVTQMRGYLERTGWRLVANHFNRKEGWTLQPEQTLSPEQMLSSVSWIYSKPGLESLESYDPHKITAFDQMPFVIEVPGCEDRVGYLTRLQYAVEWIADVEQTTFVSVVCRILNVQQLVLRPIETDLTPPDDSAEETS